MISYRGCRGTAFKVYVFVRVVTCRRPLLRAQCDRFA